MRDYVPNILQNWIMLHSKNERIISMFDKKNKYLSKRIKFSEDVLSRKS